MRSANNVDLKIGARVAALDIEGDSWIYPGIVTGIENNTANVTTDGAHILPNVISSHIWVIDLFADRPRGYWGYPNEFGAMLSHLSLPDYFNRPLPIRTFGHMLAQCMYLFLNNEVFANKVPQPNWHISNIIAWAKVKGRDLWLSTRHDTLRNLYNSVGHEMCHIYQFAHETKFGPDDLETGYHGLTFLKWREPLSKVGIILNPTDTSDTEAEITEPGTRDKPHLVLLVKPRGSPGWEGGTVNNEKTGRMLANLYSTPGTKISLVWVRNVQITRVMRPVQAKQRRVRTPLIPDNMIAWIAKNGQPILGFPLPDMPIPKESTHIDLVNNDAKRIHVELLRLGLKLVKVNDKQHSRNGGIEYMYSPEGHSPQEILQAVDRLGVFGSGSGVNLDGSIRYTRKNADGDVRFSVTPDEAITYLEDFSHPAHASFGLEVNTLN